MWGTQKNLQVLSLPSKNKRIHKGSCPLQQGGLAPNPYNNHNQTSNPNTQLMWVDFTYKTCQHMSKTKINITCLPNISLSPPSTIQLFHHNGNLTRWSFFIKHYNMQVKVSSELILRFILHEWLIEDEKIISNQYIC